MALLMRLLCIIIALTVTRADSKPLSFLSDRFINYINSHQTLWRAGRNFPINTPLAFIKTLAGTIIDDPKNYVDIFDTAPIALIDSKDLPESFDARREWSNCPYINDIREQGSCASCWAVAPAAALTDRICIRTNGSENFYFSSMDPLTCCKGCGNCESGYLFRAWSFCKNQGIVSGGKYKSDEGCKPYEFAPCNHNSYKDILQHCGNLERTPHCQDVCEDHYKISYNVDKKKCRNVFFIKNELSAMQQILEKGPITTSFQMYGDFLNYKSGVYYHVKGDYIANHSVKVLGWGVENQKKYWLVANSWNERWGDNGFFKILRGENECGIEEHFMAGLI